MIEEIARLVGYDMFDLNLPNPIKAGKLTPAQTALRKLKSGFIDIGFNEVLSYSLVPETNNDLINSKWIFIILFVFLSFEWFLRKRINII